ncbi:acetyl-CoA carboxylase, biotin carboxylase subunit [Aphanomyces invadans]|uniref:Propionyl-CoA carboxylase alpha chain, mitochondrial n=1 Tax=Aphanomyces invadans TaxID=157072 RepID=A0A024T8T8_9STRA|nr:acetyl-CoA carboxylase, biotin carboxylase subunit [Aphanomyces invadans]ETV90570.1 acetyl-CoA carboxylase, biotin carboxylase subunit [Aphanomyces invadans]|eukprot:XP_008880784.1 acetyl-CoA carboxylase, biotin carboxylase subunit [Aphanomyces invadans]
MLRFQRRALGPLQQRVASFSSTATKEKLFDKVLIANRGEIACRVIRTCRRLGIKTVAVYSEPDVNSVHVRLADEAVCVGPAKSASSYLNIDRIMDAVRQTGAQAVHPGYGFLSENKLFCEALDKAGVTFIGPGFHAIEAMGDKIESKQIAIDAGVNTIPGYQGVIQDEEEAVKVARDIGYPVMVKASAGGGGKGMRVAYNDAEVREGYRLSKEEAANSFGDDRMFIEKFIEDPRHIEIQLLADKHGNFVPFPERECSIQRRNQKVIEEAPSMLLDDATRRAMGEQAVMLAKKVGYTSAGTVEFLCDKHKNFYFLEMNTRLQVEHPVTELITKVDLVEQMLRIAAGHALPAHLTSGPLPIYGWAMESRVYAEDPLRGFLPSIGRLLTYQEPHHLPGVRVDSGVSEGSDISMHYDPMISKLVTHGKDRKECLERMKFALDHYVIRGPGNNMAFMQDVYRHPRFESGNITTKFIAEEYPEGFSGVKLNPAQTNEMIVAGALMHFKALPTAKKTAVQVWTTRSNVTVTQLPTLFQGVVSLEVENASSLDVLSWLNELPATVGSHVFVSTDGPFGQAHAVRAVAVGSTIYASVDGTSGWVVVNDFDWSPKLPLFSAEISSKQRALQVLKKLPEGFKIQHHGAIHDVIVRSPKEHELSVHMKPKPKVDLSRFVLCPMPGLLVSVAVQVGDTVQIGQEVAVVEAMKMQNVIRASKKGKIKAVLHPAGAALKVDEVIVEFE